MLFHEPFFSFGVACHLDYTIVSAQNKSPLLYAFTFVGRTFIDDNLCGAVRDRKTLHQIHVKKMSFLCDSAFVREFLLQLPLKGEQL